jgi:hypothetical protein
LMARSWGAFSFSIHSARRRLGLLALLGSACQI